LLTTPPSNADVPEVVADARWLLSRAAAAAKLEFVWLPREDHSRVSFLADQYLRQQNLRSVHVDIAAVQSALSPALPPCHYIFHSAFCCSTLMIRALDIPGSSFGLNEPQILIELAGMMRQGKLDPQVLRTVVTLLARPFSQGEMTVVKPGNEANLLIDPLLRLDERSRGLLLYAPLPRFLRSIARKQLWGRFWARRLFLLLRRDYGLSLGFSEAEQFEQTDLQVAALAWLHHHAQFASLLARFPDRLRALDSDSFLAQRASSLAAVGRHFGLAVEQERWNEVVESKVFASHSKEIGRSFTPETETEHDAEMPLIDEEIAMVVGWTKTIAEGIGLSLELPKALDAAMQKAAHL
jgi:hypothetical protein